MSVQLLSADIESIFRLIHAQVKHKWTFLSLAINHQNSKNKRHDSNSSIARGRGGSPPDGLIKKNILI